jgi:Holliday junction resolvase RusA-like endonuclease
MPVYRLPVPPSLNNAYVNVRGRGRVPSAKLVAWKREAAAVLQGQVQPVSGPFTVEILLPEKTRGDIDNRIKPILDALVTAGATPDDRLARKVSIERADREDVEARVG